MAGRFVVVIGGAIVALGIVLMASDDIPFLGKLPGDIIIRNESFFLLIPITSSILLSIVITMILWAVSHVRGKGPFSISDV